MYLNHSKLFVELLFLQTADCHYCLLENDFTTVLYIFTGMPDYTDLSNSCLLYKP